VSNFETVVQVKIYETLSNNAPLMAAIKAVYDDVPQPISSGDASAFPYVVIGEDNHADTSTDLELSNLVSITIHTWSRYTGRAQTKQIQGLIYDALNRAVILDDNYKFINIFQDSSDSFLDSDGFTRHGTQTFNLMIEEF
jgi:hypothetical protein